MLQMIDTSRALKVPPPLDAGTAKQRVIDFMRDASFEATRPSNADIRTIGGILAPGMSVYLTALPGRDPTELVATAMSVRDAGLEPVPHIAARHFDDMRAVDRLLSRLNAEARVTRIMLIGGDTGTPAGSVQDAQQVIDSGVLQGNGIREIGLPGYPDGHPVLSDDEVECSLVTKLAAAQSAGLEPHIVTQFCFDVPPILRWIEWLRDRGLHVPVRVGFAGPTSLMTWLNFARKCGVRASAEALAKRSGLIKQAFRTVAPDPLIRQVAEATAGGRLGDVSPHIFSFGGIASTARWTMGPVTGDLRLTPEGGFTAE
jgi:methylenetetrahydrofolate reductase (NADPH)